MIGLQALNTVFESSSKVCGVKMGRAILTQAKNDFIIDLRAPKTWLQISRIDTC